MRIVAGRHRGQRSSRQTGWIYGLHRTACGNPCSMFWNIVIGGKGCLHPLRRTSSRCILRHRCLRAGALSRGAGRATFMDNNNTAIDLCRRNIAALKEHERIERSQKRLPPTGSFTAAPRSHISRPALQSKHCRRSHAKPLSQRLDGRRRDLCRGVQLNEQINPAADTTLFGRPQIRHDTCQDFSDTPKGMTKPPNFLSGVFMT